MKKKITKDLRRLARQKWLEMDASYRPHISERRLYQQLKREYKNETR